jgi:hypothetical protein
MEPPENPTRNLRTSADRVSEASPLVWLVLGLATVALYAALAFGLTDLLNS